MMFRTGDIVDMAITVRAFMGSEDKKARTITILRALTILDGTYSRVRI